MDFAAVVLTDIVKFVVAEYAKIGLRTLVLGYKVVDEASFAQWMIKHKECKAAVENRCGCVCRAFVPARVAGCLVVLACWTSGCERVSHHRFGRCFACVQRDAGGGVAGRDREQHDAAGRHGHRGQAAGQSVFSASALVCLLPALFSAQPGPRSV